MKYIFLNALEGYGGLEIQMLKRAEDAMTLGHSVLVIVLSNTRIEEYCKYQKIPYRSINIHIDYFDIFAAFQIGKIFVNFRADVCVVGKTVLLSLVVFARNKFYNKTRIILYQQMQSGLKKIDLFHNWIYRNLNGAIVIAEFMKYQLSETTIFPIEKIVKIPYGIHTEQFSRLNYDKNSLRVKYGLPKESFVIGTVGRIEPHKDQMTTINAFAEANIKGSFLFFVGNVDNEVYHRKIIERINELNIREKVKFLEFTDQIPEIMNLLDVFVLSSLSETLGLVVLEAMSAGLPVIATHSGGVVELISDNENGLFFEPKDEEKLRQHLITISDDEVHRKYLAKNAENFAVENFNYNLLTEKFFDYCKNCKL